MNATATQTNHTPSPVTPSPRTPRKPRREWHEGEEVVLVPLASTGQVAIVDAADFDRLMAKGFSDQWTWNLSGNGYGYVRAGGKFRCGSLETVSRLIVEAEGRDIVRYHNGNRLDLRRSNLQLLKRAKSDIHAIREAKKSGSQDVIARAQAAADRDCS